MTTCPSPMQDMRQIWVNCHLYNKKETPIDRAGRQAEQLFQEKWNRSGFAAADARARRNNAGVAAPKFEPNEYGPPEKKLQRRSSGSKNGRTSVKKVCISSCCIWLAVCFTCSAVMMLVNLYVKIVPAQASSRRLYCIPHLKAGAGMLVYFAAKDISVS